jgi:hypothetical protein
MGYAKKEADTVFPYSRKSRGFKAEGFEMKIKVKGEKLVKAVQKMYGIEIEVESPEDAREAIDLILSKMANEVEIDYKKLEEIEVKPERRYETSAVDYKMTFLLTFSFKDEASVETRVAVIKDFQEFFAKL